MENNQVTIKIEDLSEETKNFIGKFQQLSQEKYDKVANEVSKGPVTIPKVNWMVQ